MRKKEIEKRIAAVQKQAAQVKTDLIHEVVTMLSDVDGNKISMEENEEDPVMVSYDGGSDPQRSTLFADVLEVSLYKGKVSVRLSTPTGVSADVWLGNMPFQDVVAVFNAVKSHL